ncbi:excisionase [Steroidobacter flavus]|uniref:Excisionase n=1 Tax=Steroidobacter flavus TaxID=1842136 RepID=A0ABV8T3E4_9GAMM
MATEILCGTKSITIAPARYVLLPIAQWMTGYTVKEMERKIERGDWQEGKVWRRAPDGHICIDIVGYEKWIEG